MFNQALYKPLKWERKQHVSLHYSCKTMKETFQKSFFNISGMDYFTALI